MGGRSGLIYMVSLVLNSSVLLMSSKAGGSLFHSRMVRGPEAVFVFITVTLNCEELWLYSSKSGCVRAKVVVFGQNLFFSGQVFVHGLKLMYSGKGGCIRA